MSTHYQLHASQLLAHLHPRCVMPLPGSPLPPELKFPALLSAGVHPIGRDRVIVQATVALSDLATIDAAEWMGAEAARRIAEEAEEAVVDSDARREAIERTEKLQVATEQLAAAIARRDECQREYRRAVSREEDPRPLRPALNAAQQEVDDLTSWRDSLLEGRSSAAHAFATVRHEAQVAAAERILEDVADRRRTLLAEVRDRLGEWAAALLLLDAEQTAAQTALSAPRPAPPASPLKSVSASPGASAPGAETPAKSGTFSLWSTPPSLPDRIGFTGVSRCVGVFADEQTGRAALQKIRASGVHRLCRGKEHVAGRGPGLVAERNIG